MNAAAWILSFDQPGTDNAELVGGKGMNLAACATSGFPVPPGFCITTEAYREFLERTRLAGDIERMLRGIDPGDPVALDVRTAQIRAAILDAPVPDRLIAELGRAYADLGDDARVAVRSSGTAEDLTEASFAGLHDTLLNVQGPSALIDAVRACWASLWTSRATGYRLAQGLHDPSLTRMAAVVQRMVSAEVAGVMFTANPMTTATDELVVNANWGLGESVAAGLVTPDEFVVKVSRPLAVGLDQRPRRGPRRASLAVKRRTIGAKELCTDSEVGQGTRSRPTADTRRDVPSLSDDQLIDLAELGLRVQSHYDDLPQDIEWAYADGEFWLLQARPITGVAFDWAADMETFQCVPDDEATLWTGAWSNILTGAKSPLYYHWSTEADMAGFHSIGNMLGIRELMGPAHTTQGADVNRAARLQVHKYHRGEVYHNTEFEKILQAKIFPPSLRPPGVSPFLAPEQAAEVQNTPFSYKELLKGLARLELCEPRSGLTRWYGEVRRYVAEAPTKWNVDQGPEPTGLTDTELKDVIDHYWTEVARLISWVMVVYAVYIPFGLGLLAQVLRHWYDGEHDNAFAELCQGVSTRSKTLEENLALFDLSQIIRHSATLSATFAQHTGADFFRALEDTEEGRTFLASYRDFVHDHGHRGHEDRDFCYPRRYEDPAIDYRSFRLLLAGDEDPRERERALHQRRDEVYADVVRSLKRTPLLGGLKATAFSVLYDQVQKLLLFRDDERWAYEHTTLGMKLLFRELGARLTARGILTDPDDYYLFTKHELYELLDGGSNPRLAQAKARARRHDLTEVLESRHNPPPYLRDGRPVHLRSADGDAPGDHLRGIGWTSGTVTGTARVVGRLSEIDRIEPGDILVCTSTDPGWTPVFMAIGGIVTETGGVLSHASCLAREYGLPAVQLPGARRSVPDGATITLDGASGQITIHRTELESDLVATSATPGVHRS